MSAAAIRVEQLVVEADGHRILGPAELEAAASEHVLLVGPSGCGKTTLLRAIAGLVAPSSGRVRLFGELATDGRSRPIPPDKRAIGFLFQGGALWPHMSVRRTLDFVMRYAGVPRAEWSARRAKLLGLVDLEGFDERRPATLSGGEGQRLALARALASQPRILLLDEPLGPLDAARRTGLLESLRRLRAELHLTVLHVTHDPGEARGVSTRTLSMEAGRIVDEEHHE